MKRKVRHINIQPDAQAKNYLVSNWQVVYKDPDDERCGIPPLFEFKFVIQNMDMSRIKQCPSVNITYEITDTFTINNLKENK